MKILFTGMATHHSKSGLSGTFVSGLSKIAENFAEVTWAEPKVDWKKEDLAEFDFVFVGICPPTAPSANNLYGALNTLNILWDTGKLRLIADYPQLWQYKLSFNQVLKNPERALFATIFSRRPGFKESSSKAKTLAKAVEKLASRPWPLTIYPSLPWQDSKKVEESFNIDVDKSLVGINVDSLFIDTDRHYFENIDKEASQWLVQDIKNPWTANSMAMVRGTCRDLRKELRKKDISLEDLLSTSIALMVPPERRSVGIWWSRWIHEAINHRKPIVTDWKEVIDFHWSWSNLAYQVEDMTSEERQRISTWQLKSYLGAIPDAEQLKLWFSDILFKSDAKEKANA